MIYPIFGNMITNVFNKFVGVTSGGSLPPSFPDDLTDPSTLLVYLDGTNSSPTTKKDVVNGYDFTAVQGPCLTLAVGESIPMIGFGTITSSGGTAVLTYDGASLVCTTGGTVFNLLFSSGIIFSCSEGAATQIIDTTGAYKVSISAILTPWVATQDLFFDAMNRGWFEDDVAADGVQYPADPTTPDKYNLTMEVEGAGTVAIDSIDYTLGTNQITDLSGATQLTATYGTGDVWLTYTGINGAEVTGSYPDYALDIDASKQINAVFDSENSEEFTATVILDGVVGGTYDFGTDASPLLHMQVTSRSWDVLGVETTKVRTVYGKKVRRKPYPNELLREELAVDSRVLVQVILNDFVYTDDVITDLTFEAGFFVDDGVGGTGLPNAQIIHPTAKNKSPDAYPAPISTWINHDLERVETVTHTVRLVTGHRHFEQGQLVRAVKFIATDESLNTTEVISSTMSQLPIYVSGLSGSCFEGTLDFTTLNQGEMVTIDAIIYPWIGDAWQASVDGAVYPSPNMTVLKFLNDKTGAYGTAYAYVDGVGGTPAVSEDAATAATTPYDTVANAAAAIQVYNNANLGRNSASGGVVRLEAGTHTHSSYGSVAVDTIPLVVRGLDRATSIYQDAGVSTTGSIPDWLKLANLTLQKNGDSIIFLDNRATIKEKLLVLEDVTFDINGRTVYNAWIYKIGMLTLINCDGDKCGQTEVFGVTAKQAKLIGCGGNMVGSAVYDCVATKDLNCEYVFGSEATEREKAKGTVLAFSHLSQGADGAKPVYSNDKTFEGIGIFGTVVEQYGGATGPSLSVNADDAYNSVVNYMDIANTVVGARSNTLYQDTAGEFAKKDGVNSLSYHYDFNIKSDIFANDGAMIGNWSHVNSVGSRYLAVGVGSSGDDDWFVGSWLGEVKGEGFVTGTDAVPMVTDWLDDASFHGTALGNGDYTPGPLTELPQIPAGETAFPFDMKGRAVPTDGTAYVGAIQKV